MAGPQGNVVWKDSSAVIAKKHATALDRYAKTGGEVGMHPIRLAIGLDDRLLDVPLYLADGS